MTIRGWMLAVFLFGVGWLCGQYQAASRPIHSGELYAFSVRVLDHYEATGARIQWFDGNDGSLESSVGTYDATKTSIPPWIK
jgi:hypothetical protein